MPADANREGSIRLYLMYLDDPNSLRDEAEIKEREESVSAAKDPVDKLKALAALEKAQEVDGSQFRDAFIRDAKAWSDENDVTASAFLQMGVPAADLADAGFDVSPRKPARAAAGRPGARSRTRVTADTVRNDISSRTEPFTTAAVQESTGASLGTVRKVVAEMVDSGVVGDLGEDPNHDGRGRAPRLYAKA